jgi:hypothetical protein
LRFTDGNQIIPPKKNIGRIISLAVIVYTTGIGFAALLKSNFSPRTDDAEVFAVNLQHVPIGIFD